MVETQAEPASDRKPLRLWPGVVAVVLQWLLRFVVPAIFPETLIFGILAGMVLGLVVLVWWLCFSRARWVDRVGGVVLIIAAMMATRPALHPSVAGGHMGAMFFLYGTPVVCLAFVIWAAAGRKLPDGLRRATMVASVVVACAAFTLVRTDGITGDGAAQFAWRWTPDHEARLLAQRPADPGTVPAPPARAAETPKEPVLAAARVEPKATPEAVPPPAKAEPADWPAFRGPARDGVVRGIRIDTDWPASPPAELWRRPIGPGWSSFVADGDLFYTQEQRGEHELVSCYRLTTGQPVWSHRDAVRFWESNAGAGPRGTPAVSNGRVYALGATGIVNALDARTGSVVWSRNAAADTDTKIPTWGFSASPLVIGDVVIVAASGQLIAYEAATGAQRWLRPGERGSYSSPHPVALDGVKQIVLLSGVGASGIALDDGKLLWQNKWEGTPIVQPAVTGDGDLLITTADASGGLGIRRLKITRASSGWNVEERWTSNGLKPYFNHFVVHKGHAFGFDARILSCIDLQDGHRKWKGGRYGHGQLVLLGDQDLLLVLSEEGELALVKATPEEFSEVAKMPAIQGKTWNHPAIVRDILLVRNGEEMAAFRLSLAQ